MDFELWPVVAIGAAGVAVGRMWRRRENDGDSRSPMRASARVAGRAVGATGRATAMTAATGLRAGGAMARGVGLVVVRSGAAAGALARAVENASRPAQ
jgi:hypothetical protein